MLADYDFPLVAWGIFVMFVLGYLCGAALFFELRAAAKRKRYHAAMDKLKREELALSERVKPIMDVAAKTWMDWYWQGEEMDSLQQWIEKINDDIGIYTKLDIKNHVYGGQTKVHGLEVQVVDKESYLGVKCCSKVKDY